MATAPSYIIKEGAVGLEGLENTAWKVLEREDYSRILLQNAVKKLVLLSRANYILLCAFFTEGSYFDSHSQFMFSFAL